MIIRPLGLLLLALLLTNRQKYSNLCSAPSKHTRAACKVLEAKCCRCPLLLLLLLLEMFALC